MNRNLDLPKKWHRVRFLFFIYLKQQTNQYQYVPNTSFFIPNFFFRTKNFTKLKICIFLNFMQPYVTGHSIIVRKAHEEYVHDVQNM